MNKKEKNEKKSFIGQAIDLANGRYKDSEIDTLYDLVMNRDSYDGTSKTHKSHYTSFSSDGKFRRDEEDTYTLRSDDTGVRVEHHYNYHDDDGQSGSSDNTFNTGREILKLLGKLFEE